MRSAERNRRQSSSIDLDLVPVRLLEGASVIKEGEVPLDFSHGACICRKCRKWTDVAQWATIWLICAKGSPEFWGSPSCPLWILGLLGGFLLGWGSRLQAQVVCSGDILGRTLCDWQWLLLERKYSLGPNHQSGQSGSRLQWLSKLWPVWLQGWWHMPNLVRLWRALQNPSNLMGTWWIFMVSAAVLQSIGRIWRMWFSEGGSSGSIRHLLSVPAVHFPLPVSNVNTASGIANALSWSSCGEWHWINMQQLLAVHGQGEICGEMQLESCRSKRRQKLVNGYRGCWI